MRVEIDGFASAVHIVPVAAPSKLYYTLQVSGQALGGGQPNACSKDAQNQSAIQAHWKLLDGGEGDYILSDASQTNALGVLDGESTLQMSPLNLQYGQRWIIEDVGDGRRSFRNRATDQVLSWSPGSCPQLAADRSTESTKWTLLAH